jgi:hypothetical protein
VILLRFIDLSALAIEELRTINFWFSHLRLPSPDHCKSEGTTLAGDEVDRRNQRRCNGSMVITARVVNARRSNETPHFREITMIGETITIKDQRDHNDQTDQNDHNDQRDPNNQIDLM